VRACNLWIAAAAPAPAARNAAPKSLEPGAAAGVPVSTKRNRKEVTMTRFTLLASAAALAATPAFADNHGDGGDQMNGDQTMNEQAGVAQNDYESGRMGQNLDNMLRTSEMTGADVYVIEQEWTDEEWAATEVFDEVGSEWEDAGDVTDVVLSPDGQAAGIVVSHGGFLDIGDDTVLLSMKDVRRIDAGGETVAYVTNMTEESLENMPEVEENWW
jgi:hypothetical protein